MVVRTRSGGKPTRAQICATERKIAENKQREKAEWVADPHRCSCCGKRITCSECGHIHKDLSD